MCFRKGQVILVMRKAPKDLQRVLLIVTSQHITVC